MIARGSRTAIWICDLSLIPRADECSFAFLKDTTHGLEGASDGIAEAGNGGVEHETVAVTFQPIEITCAYGFILRQMDSLNCEPPLQALCRTGKFAGEADIKQIEA